MTLPSERHKQIELLLRSRHDFDPSDIRDSLASLKTTRGPAPSKRVECPDCGGEGAKRVRGFLVGCRNCGGSDHAGLSIGGFQHIDDFNLTGIRGRGWIEVDDYTGQTVSTLAAPQPERMTSVVCDGCGGSGVRVRREG